MIRSTDASDAVALRNIFKDLMLRYRGAMPAFISKVNTVSGALVSVDLQPAIRQSISIDGVTTHASLPILVEIPVHFPYSSKLGFSITLPMSLGDNGLIMCCDRNNYNWKISGEEANTPEPGDPRTYNLSDAIFIPGLITQATGITNYDAEAIELRNSTASVSIKLNGSEISLKVGGSSIVITAAGVTITGGTLEANGISLDQHTHQAQGEFAITSAPLP